MVVIEGFPEGTGYQCYYATRIFGCASMVFAKKGQFVFNFVMGMLGWSLKWGAFSGFFCFEMRVGLPCLLNSLVCE